MSSLLPHNTTPLERATEKSDALIERARAPLQTIWDAERAPAQLLPWLAWAVGVDDWDTDWTEQQKRAATDEAIPIRRKRGTVWAVRRTLEALGYTGVEILEHAEQSKKWEEAGGSYVDGTWVLDGSRVLGGDLTDPPRVVTTMWAQYALAFDISDAPFRPRDQRTIRARVEAAAPLRSELLALIYRYAAAFDARIMFGAPQITVNQQYVGCRGEQVYNARLLNGCWSLSGDYVPRLLSGEQWLDGTWALSGQRPVGFNLDQGWGTADVRVTHSASLAMQAESDNDWTLGESEIDTLDGSWALNEILDGHRLLDNGWTLGVSCLYQLRRPRLNGARTLGATGTINSIGTTASAALRDRRIKTEIRV